MLHCYKDLTINDESQKPSSISRKSSNTSLISLIKTRSNYSAVLTIGLNHVLSGNFLQRETQTPIQMCHLLQYHSMNFDSDFEIKTCEEGGQNEDGLLRAGSDETDKSDTVTSHKKLPDTAAESRIYECPERRVNTKLSRREKENRKEKNSTEKNDSMPGTTVGAPGPLMKESRAVVTSECNLEMDCQVSERVAKCGKTEKLKKFMCCTANVEC